MARAQSSQDNIGVGDRWFCSSSTICGGAGFCSRTLRPQSEGTSFVNPSNRTSAGAHFGEIYEGISNRITAAFDRSSTMGRACCFKLICDIRFKIVDDPRLSSCSTHVECRDLVELKTF